jgi:imidazolonepropionase-like amidohydrolase
MYAAHMRDLHARFRETARSAIEAGIDVYAGTDAGGGIAHGRLVDELIALRDTGMSNEDALAAGSWKARGWLGWSPLDEGAAADLLVLESDPRTDLDALRHPRLIMLRGRVVR